MTGDRRVTRARDLLAERHEPITMTAGDLRALLARYQRRVHEVLEIIDRPPVTEVTAAGTATLTPADLQTVLRALDDAAAWRQHAGLPSLVSRYRALARTLGDDP